MHCIDQLNAFYQVLASEQVLVQDLDFRWLLSVLVPRRRLKLPQLHLLPHLQAGEINTRNKTFQISRGSNFTSIYSITIQHCILRSYSTLGLMAYACQRTTRPTTRRCTTSSPTKPVLLLTPKSRPSTRVLWRSFRRIEKACSSSGPRITVCLGLVL